MMDRLRRDEPVVYQLQIQLNDTPERPHVWNPQLVYTIHAPSALSRCYCQFSHMQHTDGCGVEAWLAAFVA